MIKLSELGLKKTYKTDNSNLIKDFYIKALSECTQYDRATFTFGSSILSVAARGLDGLIDNDGRMRLIIGQIPSRDDYEALEDGSKMQIYQDDCLEHLKSLLALSRTSSLSKHRLDLLKYFIGANRLEIRFAAAKAKGIFHDKSGIIYGRDNEKIAFMGSSNETLYGTDINWERINAYFSWEDAYSDYGQEINDDFESLWKGHYSSKCKLIELPNEEIKKAIGVKSSYVGDFEKPSTKELILIDSEEQNLTPMIPSKIGDNDFEIRDYQIEALRNWKTAGYKGVMAHATGSGKTITAIYGITRTFLSGNTNVVAIVGVPYTILAEQWADEFKLFNIKPILCFGNSSSWFSKVSNRLSELSISSTNQLVVLIVVNASIFMDRFQQVLSDLDKEYGLLKEQTIFIGDECHEYAGKKDINKLPNCSRRLGLSATPFVEKDREDSIKKDNNLKSYFGETCDTFELADALEEKFLCPYEYHPIIVHLNEEEEEQYGKLSAQIAQIISDPKNLTNEGLNILAGLRSRLIGSTEEKFIKLKSLAKELNSPTNTLVFCGDGKTEEIDESEQKDKQRAKTILDSVGWRTREFTAEVSQIERASRIEDFKDKDINALIAIKVLDQGVNIPAIATAIILASTRSKRQYIQRLGRVLRKSKGKKMSYIYDFIVLPRDHKNRELSESLINLISEESVRFEEFAKNADNYDKLSVNKINIFGEMTSEQ